uniref:Uncharacterized protein n=1 Tax=Arundo donax TaxID=35708 RepID=A0A0A9FMQ0_ARUDO
MGCQILTLVRVTHLAFHLEEPKDNALIFQNSFSLVIYHLNLIHSHIRAQYAI